MSSSWDPVQAQHIVGPELDPNCLQKLSTDNTCRLSVKPNIKLTPIVKGIQKANIVESAQRFLQLINFRPILSLKHYVIYRLKASRGQGGPR